MTPAQLNTLNCFPPQFLAVWQKLGGEYATWKESDVHRLAFEAKITLCCRKRFEDYLSGEAGRAIGFFIYEIARFKDLYFKKWTGEKAEREARELELAALLQSCMTYEQAAEWVDENKPFCKFPEVMERMTTYRTVSYYRRRDKRLFLFTKQEAEADFRTFIGHENMTFNDLYEPGRYPGWDSTLWKRTFDV